MQPLQSLDVELLEWLRAWHAPWLDVVMSAVTIGGIMGGVWQLLALIGLTRARWRAAAWRTLLTVWLALLVVDGLAKPLVNRPRPTIPPAPARSLPPASLTTSFPSGHATSAFAGAVAVSRMWPATRIAWWILALLIASSRIYLGHHYPLDVVGGALLGIAIALWVLGGRHPATYANTLP
ncbi:MAG TPA: phosphatase PAP2 family protein, partial [Vicinamibacterales bacterium]|nr:phosphatase PAP2 family protein [Vicinamibacterales bacterium]